MTLVVLKERHEDAHKILSSLHAKRGVEFVQQEMSEIQQQLSLEKETRGKSSWGELFSLRYARRLLLACFIMNMTKLSGGKKRVTIYYQNKAFALLNMLLSFRGCCAKLPVTILCRARLQRPDSPAS